MRGRAVLVRVRRWLRLVRPAKGDLDGVQQVFTAVDHLAHDPRPQDAFGSGDVLRIHVGA
jgi:mRNA interferase RelE/StbE